MTILIMNRLPYEKAPYDKWLNSLNKDLLLLTSEESLDGFPTDCYKFIKSFPNYYDNGNVEVTVLDLYEKFKFDTIIALSELDLIRAARLREKLKLKGQDLNSALAFRDKVYMKTILASNNILVPRFKKLDSVIDLLEFISDKTYPFVIKPIDGSASEDITILYNENDLKNYLELGLKSNLQIEEFIDGDMYPVDGFIVNNKVSFIWPSKYINGCLAFKENKYLGSYPLSLKNPLVNRLNKFVESILKNLPTPKDTAFHAEVFHTKNDQLVLCEIASRTGGAHTSEVIQNSFGIHLNESSVKSQCNINIKNIKDDSTRQLCGYVFIPTKRGRFIGASEYKPNSWVLDYKVYAKPNEVFEEAKLSIDKIASFLITGKNENELVERIHFIADWFEKNTKWELFD